MSTSRRGFLKSIIAAIALSPVLCRFAKEEVVYEAPGEWKQYPFPHKLDLNPPRFNFVNGEFVRVA